MAPRQMLIRIYENVLTELEDFNIPDDVKPNVVETRLMGMWPTKNDSTAYRGKVVLVYIFCCLLFPTTQILNIFAAASIYESLGCVFLSIAHFSIAFRTATFFGQEEKLRQLFSVHAAIKRDANAENKQIYDRVTRFNIILHIFFQVSYNSAWLAMIAQAIYSSTSLAWPSTSNMPEAIARNRTGYWCVFIYQFCCDVVLILQTASQDSFIISLITMTNGHVAVLKARLRNLPNDDYGYFAGLIECCKMYEDCLR